MCAPSEKFLTLSGPLAMGLGALFVANIGSFFFPPHSALGASKFFKLIFIKFFALFFKGLASFVVYGGLILFSGMLLYHTQKVVRLAETLPYSGYSSYYNQYNQPIQIQNADHYDPINAYVFIFYFIKKCI